MEDNVTTRNERAEIEVLKVKFENVEKKIDTHIEQQIRFEERLDTKLDMAIKGKADKSEMEKAQEGLEKIKEKVSEVEKGQAILVAKVSIISGIVLSLLNAIISYFTK